MCAAELLTTKGTMSTSRSTSTSRASRPSTAQVSTPARTPAIDSPAAQRPRRKRSRARTATAAPARPVARPEEPVLAAPIPAAMGFAELGVPARLVDALTERGITSPFAVQAATLPDSLAGRDVLGRGRTGSGKTLAFVLPVVTALASSQHRRQRSRPRAVILTPTRELATQVYAVLEPLAAALGLTAMTIFGGVPQNKQVRTLQRGVDVVVACPGRLEDLMRQGHVRLDEVCVTVLDEADHMADLGFLPSVRRILDATPADGQRLLFSATLDNEVDVLVRTYLQSPATHSVPDDQTVSVPIDHHVLTVHATDKAQVVRELASGQQRALLFTRTKHGARKLAGDLSAAGIPSVDLHGNLSQAVRDRHLTAFRDGDVRVLVATDIAARGIHVDDVGLVVHVDPPAEHKAFTHRSGRTARAGASGVVVTLQTPAQDRDVAVMTRKAGIHPHKSTVRPGAEYVRTLVGPQADLVQPSPAGQQAKPPRTSQPRRSSGRPRRSARHRAAPRG